MTDATETLAWIAAGECRDLPDAESLAARALARNQQETAGDARHPGTGRDVGGFPYKSPIEQPDPFPGGRGDVRTPCGTSTGRAPSTGDDARTVADQGQHGHGDGDLLVKTAGGRA
jgi:hypothetical protein